MAIILERTTDEWLGTWSFLTQALASDMLRDDPPLAVAVTLDDGTTITAPIVGVVDPERIVFDMGGSTIAVETNEIERIVIP